jgi:hypothetical protein
MRRSLRRLGHEEATAYAEQEQVFTTESLDDAKQRLAEAGQDLTQYCFFSWVREGVRYFRVWEDKRLNASIARPVAPGEVSARLKRADAEKLYIKAKRYKGDRVRFGVHDGLLQVIDAASGEVKASVCVPLTGGDLLFEPAGWNERQAAYFVNVLLVRDAGADEAFMQADMLQD